MDRKLILGMATGYSAEAVRPFLRSVLITDFNCKIVLFVHRGQAAPFQQMIKSCFPMLDVDIIKIRSIGAYSRIMRKIMRIFMHLIFYVTPFSLRESTKISLIKFYGLPHQTRYFHCAQYMRSHPEFSLILLSDIRDVVFQADPFADLADGLHLGLESPKLTIATQRDNRRWMIEVYGETLLNRLGHHQISCSGVTLGDAASIKVYVNKMLDEIIHVPLFKLEHQILDQAIHNKLLYCGELPTVHLCQPLQSTIATVGVLTEGDLTVDSTGMLLNTDGRPAPIVHQYDRQKTLADAFRIRMT
jgi:hypothetical protein